MRDPSIHIKLSDLMNILEEVAGISKRKLTLIMQEARKVSCDNRSISVSNDKVQREVTKRLKSTKGDTSLLSEVIYSVRIQLKHRGVTTIKDNDRDWLQLKELSKLLNQFCEDFKLSKREGYIAYIKIAFSKISSMHSYISKFINMYEAIVNEYDSNTELQRPGVLDNAKYVHDYFVGKIAEKTGIMETYLNQPMKMLAFYRVYVECDRIGIDPEVYVDAQFDALDWCQGMPTPESLTGGKSIDRLNKYMYQNNLTVTVKKTDTNFWNKLKQ